jgi:hypothetical protein
VDQVGLEEDKKMELKENSDKVSETSESTCGRANLP